MTFGQTSPQTHVDRLSQTQTSEIREISTCSIARNDRNSSHSDPPPVQSRDSTLSTRSRGFQLDSYTRRPGTCITNSTGTRQARDRQGLDSPSTAPRQPLDNASTAPRRSLDSCRPVRCRQLDSQGSKTQPGPVARYPRLDRPDPHPIHPQPHSRSDNKSAGKRIPHVERTYSIQNYRFSTINQT